MIQKEKCVACGTCAYHCPTTALTVLGRRITPQEAVAEVKKDQAYYETSGGGVTFSGGEPFWQVEFLTETAKLCKQEKISTCVETSGTVSWEIMESALSEIDLVLFDLKQMNDCLHREYVGAGNAGILENLVKTVRGGKSTIVRVPVIPGYNDQAGKL